MRGTTSICLVAAIAFAGAPAAAQNPLIVIASDASASSTCYLNVWNYALTTVYVVMVNSSGSSGARFSVPDPPCLQAMRAGETSPWPGVTGDSRTGIELDFGSCVTGTQVLLTIGYFTEESTTLCCWYNILAHPDAETNHAELRDCAGDYVCTATRSAIFNPGDVCISWDCYGTVPIEVSNPVPPHGATGVELSPTLTWDSINLYGNCEHWVRFGKVPTPGYVASVSGWSYSPGELEPNTTYYWQIQPLLEPVYDTWGPIWSFTTTNSVATEEVTWGHIKALFTD